jgi:hypothetical protein
MGQLNATALFIFSRHVGEKFIWRYNMTVKLFETLWKLENSRQVNC